MRCFLPPCFPAPCLLASRLLASRLLATGFPATGCTTASPTNRSLRPTARSRSSATDGSVCARRSRHHRTFLNQCGPQFFIHPRTQCIPTTTKCAHHRTTTGFNDCREPLNVPLGRSCAPRPRFNLFRNLALHGNQGCARAFHAQVIPKWIHGFTMTAPSCVDEHDCSGWTAHILDRLSGGTNDV